MKKLTEKLYQPSFLFMLLVISVVLLVAGIFLPLMTIKTLVFLRNSFSIISGIADLFTNGKFFLFIIVTVFSLILPFSKLTFLFVIVVRLQHGKIQSNKMLTLMHEYGRWSMLDVFVAAVLIVSVKLGSVASVEVHYGLYIFTLAVLLIMAATHLIVQAVKIQLNQN